MKNTVTEIQKEVRKILRKRTGKGKEFKSFRDFAIQAGFERHQTVQDFAGKNSKPLDIENIQKICNFLKLEITEL